MSFRALNANEIECRVGQISRNGSGLSLLLYKDARCDMNMLDEVVGPENWQCEFYECKGTLFCRVGIKSGGGSKMDEAGIELSPVSWVWKADAGSPSNMEAQKGEASDAFKRACFKWGIGRELYTAPRIWVYAKDRNGSSNCEIVQGNNGKYQCYDTFSVERIDIREHEILYVSIINDRTGQTVFVWAKPESQEDTTPSEYANGPSREQLEEMSGLIAELAKSRGVDADKVIDGLMRSKAMSSAGVTNGEIKTSRQAATAIGQLQAWIRNGERN